MEIGTDLRKIGAVNRTGVQINACIALFDDPFYEGFGDARSEASLLHAREGAVEVATVGRIACVPDQAVGINHGDSEQGAVKPLQWRKLQQTADNLDAVELVTVNRREDEQRRAGFLRDIMALFI